MSITEENPPFEFKIIGDVRRDVVKTNAFKKYKDKIIEVEGRRYLITISYTITNYNNTVYDNYLSVRADDLDLPGEYGFQGDLKQKWVLENDRRRGCAWIADKIYRQIINECIDFYDLKEIEKNESS